MHLIQLNKELNLQWLLLDTTLLSVFPTGCGVIVDQSVHWAPVSKAFPAQNGMSRAVLLHEQADLAGAEAAADWRMTEDVFWFFFYPRPPLCTVPSAENCYGSWHSHSLTRTSAAPRGGSWPYTSAPCLRPQCECGQTVGRPPGNSARWVSKAQRTRLLSTDTKLIQKHCIILHRQQASRKW